MESKENKTLDFSYPKAPKGIIKVIGVGGGGGNAVSHMFSEEISDVTFALCNTDNQALYRSPIKDKIQLGARLTEGLGAGNRPEIAREAAIESTDLIKEMFQDGTKMAFITAGMGGGTGTGAAPIIANIAKELGILTIGIVTIPFAFEGQPKIIQALKGVEEISKNVDALLVINNERLREIYADLSLINAFAKADDTLSIAVKSIAEIITLRGLINVDFADVRSVLKDGGVAIMSTGVASGPDRLTKAIENALTSPLLNNNRIWASKKILMNLYFSEEHEIMMEEMDMINQFMDKIDTEVETFIWGLTNDPSVGENFKITILASGFDIDNLSSIKDGKSSKAELSEEDVKRKKEQEYNDRMLIGKYYGDSGKLLINDHISRFRPYILKSEDLDDDSVLDALEKNPPSQRGKEFNPRNYSKKKSGNSSML